MEENVIIMGVQNIVDIVKKSIGRFCQGRCVNFLIYFLEDDDIIRKYLKNELLKDREKINIFDRI